MLGELRCSPCKIMNLAGRLSTARQLILNATTAPTASTPFLQLDSFDSLNLSPEILRAIDRMGYKRPTAVQGAAVPLVFAGLDLIIQSQTGTGKTAAFAIPIIDMLEVGDTPIEALVLLPTRELALQVCDQFEKLSMFKQPFGTAAIYGGAGFDAQVKALKQARVVVATPGRLLDHLERKNLSLKNLKFLILDEADEMLSLGFERDLDAILSHVPEDRQCLLFSATMSEEVRRFSSQFMHSPEFVTLSSDSVAAQQVRHLYHKVSGENRLKDLSTIIDFHQPESAIIFCNTRGDTQIVMRYLRRMGHGAELLNGDLPQSEREKALSLIRQGKARFLVATDVAARGIDISELPCVVNYAMPEGAETYIHRTGRTGRAGRTGVALSLMSPREIGTFYQLRSIYKVNLVEHPMPTREEITERREQVALDQTLRDLTANSSALDFSAYLRLAERLLPRPDAPEAIARLLALASRPSTPPPAEPQPTLSVPVLASASQPDIIATETLAPSKAPPAEAAPKVEIAPPKQEPVLVTPVPVIEPVAESVSVAPPEARPESKPDPKLQWAPLLVNFGAKQLDNNEQINDVLCELTGLMTEDFGRVAVRATQTVFDVRADYQSDVVQALQGQTWRGLVLEVAPWRAGSQSGGDRDRDRGGDRNRDRRRGGHRDDSSSRRNHRPGSSDHVPA